MYVGGKLLFADHIFNGYGNAKKDFLKQVIVDQNNMSLVRPLECLPYIPEIKFQMFLMLL